MSTGTEVRSQSSIIDAVPFYYGWIVVAAAMTGMAMTIPGQTAGVSLFIDAFIEDLRLSRSVVSVAYTIATVTAALILTQVGRWIDRFGPRLAVAVITVLFAFTCVGMGYAAGLATVFVGFTLLRALGPGSLSLASLHVVNLWFVRRRGMAIGLMYVGIAVATSFFPLLIEMLIGMYGWRSTYVIVGGGLLLLMLPVGALFFRGQPEKFGLSPDGIDDDRAALNEQTLTLDEAQRTVNFWLLTAGSVWIGAIGTGLLFHHFSIMDVNGLSRTTAAAMFLPLGIVTAVGNLGGGYLMDRVSPRYLLAATLFLFAGALSLGPFVGSLQGVWLYGTLFGLAQGMQSAIKGSGYAYYFGREHIGAIKGFSKTLFVGGTALGPLAFAAGYEFLGDYTVPFAASAALALLLGASAFLMDEKEKAAA